MRILKALGIKGLSLALAFAMTPATVPAGTPLIGAGTAQAAELIQVGSRGYYRGGRGYRGGRSFRRGRGFRGRGYRGARYYGRDRYYGRRYRRGNSGGAALAGAIIGLGVGAAIASQARPRYYRSAPRYYSAGPAAWSGEWYRYCASRYRSFDPRSGTYQPYHGPRQLCR